MFAPRTEVTIRDIVSKEETIIPTFEELCRSFGISNFIGRRAMNGERVLMKDGKCYEVVNVVKKEHLIGNTRPNIPQLCWTCQNASTGGCSWSRCLKPIKGWDAEAITQYGTIYTWHIFKCPEYVRDK